MAEAIVILCPVPAEFDAGPLARDLVERSLAACVQVGPTMTSVYRWQGALETSEERLLLIKSRPALFAAIEGAIKAFHPYEVPEILALEVCAGHAPYLAWLGAATAA